MKFRDADEFTLPSLQCWWSDVGVRAFAMIVSDLVTGQPAWWFDPVAVLSASGSTNQEA